MKHIPKAIFEEKFHCPTCKCALFDANKDFNEWFRNCQHLLFVIARNGGSDDFLIYTNPNFASTYVDNLLESKEYKETINIDEEYTLSEEEVNAFRTNQYNPGDKVSVRFILGSGIPSCIFVK